MSITDQLGQIIASIDKLPPLPEVAMRTLELANDPEASAEDIVKCIQYDPGVTTNCLRLCNSSYFGLKSKISSIKHAVVILGTNNVIRSVLVDCIGVSAFKHPQEGYGLQPGELWRHSVASAILSELLISKAGQKNNHDLFTAALLHDIGKLIIDSFIADNFEAMYSLMKENGFGIVEAEKEFFGIDHAQLGGMVAKNWKFPQPLTDAISNHHQNIKNNGKADLQTWTALSNLVYYVMQNFSSGLCHKGLICQIEQDILDCFGLKQEDIDHIMMVFPGEMKKAQHFLKIN
jgi:putative nucleotidyltransferase with HDIG domain